MDWDIVRGTLALIAAALLLSAGIEDVRTREIADWKSIALVALAPPWWWANGMSAWPGMAVQVGLAAAAFAMFAAAFHFGAMGGGDVKLIAALTLWLPLSPLATMLVVMALAGGAVTLAMLAERGVARLRGAARDDARAAPPVEVPYGVAIAIAGMVALREPILNQFC